MSPNKLELAVADLKKAGYGNLENKTEEIAVFMGLSPDDLSDVIDFIFDQSRERECPEEFRECSEDFRSTMNVLDALLYGSYLAWAHLHQPALS